MIRSLAVFRWLVVAICITVMCATAQAADEPPRWQLTVDSPRAGSVVSGTIAVRATSTPVTVSPERLVLGIGGPPWVDMHRLGKSTHWRGTIDTTLVPNGEATIIIYAWAGNNSPRRVLGSVRVTVSNPLRVYFGNIHSHTFYSDGAMLPADAYSYARDVAKLDFFALSDHLELVDAEEWRDTREAAWKANEDGAFVAFPALEWTKPQGHANLLDPPTTLWPWDTPGFYQAAADASVTAMFNHPGDGATVFDGLAYSEVGDRAMQLMEVRTPAEEQAYIRALNAGWHIAPVGTDDTHVANWGSGGAWTGVLVPSLTLRNVLWALGARHCYSTTDRNCVMSFTLNSQPMGTLIEEPVTEVSIVVEINDPDANDRIAEVELVCDGEVIEFTQPRALSCRWSPKPTPAAGPHYYFVKVTQEDGQVLYSAPVWVVVTGP